MPPSRTVIRRSPEQVTRFTIWDNYERHVGELKAIGAKDADLEPLKKAAEDVAAEEHSEAIREDRNPALEDGNIADILAPRTCANGWVIAQPTKIAKRWAVTAMMRVTGGDVPDSGISLTYAILAALWALKTWGDGQRDDVMQTVMGSGRLAELIPALEDQSDLSDQSHIQALVEDYQELMGISRKKALAMQAYQEALSAIRTRFSPRSTAASSASGSAPGESSASAGPSSETSSPTGS